MKGSFHQSRKQSDFYNRLKEGERKEHALDWVATLNYQLLKPFIEITYETKHSREVFYEINTDRLLKVEEENKLLREEIERLKLANNN